MIKTRKRLERKLRKHGVTLNIKQFIDRKHQHSVWYNGEVATAEIDGCLIRIKAEGPVAVTLFGEGRITAATPECGTGDDFRTIMSPFFPDDNAVQTSVFWEHANWQLWNGYCYEVYSSTNPAHLLGKGIFNGEILSEVLLIELPELTKKLQTRPAPNRA